VPLRVPLRVLNQYVAPTMVLVEVSPEGYTRYSMNTAPKLSCRYEEIATRVIPVVLDTI
jgi:hypothetical protein